MRPANPATDLTGAEARFMIPRILHAPITRPTIALRMNVFEEALDDPHRPGRCRQSHDGGIGRDSTGDGTHRGGTALQRRTPRHSSGDEIIARRDMRGLIVAY
jgi:hypothetical protein